MKRPEDVGRDFDEYARRWAEQEYALEVGWDGSGVARGDVAAVRRPGDEWGEQQKLVDDYTALVSLLRLPPTVNVLEIGAGGGRSTEALLQVLGTRAGTYHVIDVADAFVDTLRARIDRDLDIHIVSDVDTSFLEPRSIDLCLAQSSWSHVSLYDQYRYLRDIRTALTYRAPVVVSGVFMVGLGDDWTWNRFRRRVYQIDHRIDGVYHEFTSASGVAEMLARLGYTDIVLAGNAFVARRGKLVEDQYASSLTDVTFRRVGSLAEWAAGVPGVTVSMSGATTPPTPAGGDRRGLTARVRRRISRAMGR